MTQPEPKSPSTENGQRFETQPRGIVNFTPLIRWLFDLDDTKRPEFFAARTLRIANAAAFGYVGVAVVSLMSAAAVDPKIMKTDWRLRVIAAFVGLLLTCGPPLWFWMEARAFDEWINAKHHNLDEQKSYRETFRINMEHAKAFWASILAVSVGILLAWK